MVVWTVVVLVLACPGIGWSQIDIESRRQDGRSGLAGGIDLNLAAREGNVDLFEVGTGVSLSYRENQNTLVLVASGDLGWQGGERFSNEVLGHLRYVRQVSDRVFGESFLQSNYDKSRNLDFRMVGGGGLRLSLLETDGSKAWLGLTYMFEHERNEIGPGDRHPAETSVHRGSGYLSARMNISETAHIEGTVYLQPELVNLDDLRILIDSALKVSVTSKLSLHTSVSLRHDSDPVDSVSESDFRLETGLSLEW